LAVALHGDRVPSPTQSSHIIIVGRFQRPYRSGRAQRKQRAQLEYAELNFEGGNIVADEEFVFIGANTIRINAIQKGQPERDIAEQFRELLGKQIIVLGPAPQPIGHIDMMLTPPGNCRLMLADPGWGARIAAQELANNPKAVSRFEQVSVANFFGHSDITAITTLDGKEIHPPPILGTTAQVISESQAIAKTLDRVAETLTDLDFEVIRVPSRLWLGSTR
jgi:hypothetical protein